MFKTLIVVVVICVFSVAQATPPQKRFNFNLNDLLSNQNVQDIQNQINVGLNNLKDQVEPFYNTPQAEPKPTPGALISSLNISQTDLQLATDWIVMNLEFLVNRTALSDLEKKAILNAIPRLIAANTQQDVIDAIEPLIFSGFIVFFEDPYIIFESNPYLTAAHRFLEQFFQSPQAPEFLANDQALQAQILEYVDTLFAQGDLNSALNVILLEVNKYMEAAVAQSLKPYIAMYVPELYQLVQYETDFTNIVMITYQYALTNTVGLYSTILGIIMPILTGNQTQQLQENMKMLASLSELAKTAFNSRN